MWPEGSNATLQLSLGLMVTVGFGEPDLASWALVSSATVVPLSAQRSPEASKAKPPAP
jgi:hypothetical protein